MVETTKSTAGVDAQTLLELVAPAAVRTLSEMRFRLGYFLVAEDMVEVRPHQLLATRVRVAQGEES
jgi:hypothetical protein